MPYTPPTNDDINHFVWVQPDMKLERSFDGMLKGLARLAHAVSGTSLRIDALKKTELALSVILANLYRAHLRDPNLYVAIPRASKDFKAGPYNPFGINIQAIRRAMNLLQARTPPYVEVRGGNKDRESGRGYKTRVRLGERLMMGMDQLAVRSLYSPHNYPITRNTFIDNPSSILNSSVFHHHPLPIIRLRG